MRKWMWVSFVVLGLGCSSDDGDKQNNNGTSTNNETVPTGDEGCIDDSAPTCTCPDGTTSYADCDLVCDCFGHETPIDMSSIADAGSDAGSDAGTPDMGSSANRVAIPAGTFTMGCDGVDCQVDEQPAHEVTLSAFEIDRTEVSQTAYQACIDAGDCSAPAENFDPATTGGYPVVNVTWAQAQEYCAWAGGRLPTEAEWERACTGGDAREYSWGDDPATCDLANTSGCGPDDSNAVRPVESTEAGASAEGALNLVGNVWEWTADYYAEDAYASHEPNDPTGPASGDTRTYRGGSSGNALDLGRCRNRANTYNPDVGGSGLGFRCAY